MFLAYFFNSWDKFTHDIFPFHCHLTGSNFFLLFKEKVLDFSWFEKEFLFFMLRLGWTEFFLIFLNKEHIWSVPLKCIHMFNNSFFYISRLILIVSLVIRLCNLELFEFLSIVKSINSSSLKWNVIHYWFNVPSFIPISLHCFYCLIELSFWENSVLLVFEFISPSTDTNCSIIKWISLEVSFYWFKIYKLVLSLFHFLGLNLIKPCVW